jgi:hypothetical protein
MRKLIAIVSVSIICFSCSQHIKQTANLRDRNEDELINQLFWQLVLPIPACDQSDSTMEENEIYTSEFYSMLESKHHEIYVLDTLSKLDISDYKTIEMPIDFKQLYSNLFNDTTSKARKLNLNPSEISFDIKIRIDINKDSLHLDRFESQNILALIELSRVSFNEDYSKACFQMSIIQNKECYQSFLYLADKQSDKWKFKRRLRLK